MPVGGENPEIPGAYVLDIVELCGRMGVSAEALLAGTGLSREALRDPAARVAVAVCATIAERAHVLTREPGAARSTSACRCGCRRTASSGSPR